MKTKEMTERQKIILKHIVNEYIATATAVGSKTIISKYMPEISGATVRNDMAYLEELGYLEKNHTSSGRIPSNLAYKFYEKNFSSPVIEENLKLKLRNVFLNRKTSINAIIDESCKIISEATHLPLITIENTEDVLLKRIDLIVINNQTALIVLITSSGDINKNIIQLNDAQTLKDISICIRIFNDRLIDCPISQLNERLNSSKEIIRQKVQGYEFVLEEVIDRIFTFKTKVVKNVHGQSSLLSLPEFQDRKKLEEILKILESTSIWEHIAFRQEQTGMQTIITFGDEVNHEDFIFASTDIDLGDESKTKIVIVSPTRVDYSKIKGLLEYIKNEFEKEIKK